MNYSFIITAALLMMAVYSCETSQKKSGQINPQPLNQMQVLRLKQDAAAIASSGTTTAARPVQRSSAVKLNPAHGQPGHRCDIPVGSPLPATPLSAAAGVQNSSSSPAVSNTGRLSSESERSRGPSGIINPAANAPRLNPPHGEPGHRCEIPVGSPLP